MEFKHVSVLLRESVDSLNIKDDGIYVDCTAGGGGHTSQIAERLTTGKVIAIDQDPDAIKVLNERFQDNSKVIVVHDNFENIKSIVLSLGFEKLDGVLADLGVSSHQLDDGERGFSFHQDAALDMRMSQQGATAADVINSLSERELSVIFQRYGEEKFARNIARNIVKERQLKKIETTFELAEIVKYSIPAAARRSGGHPARRVFQAVRIYVNHELDRLENSLDDMFDLLNPGGRLSIITFHSLEDRMVKKKFAAWCVSCTCPPSSPICTCGGKADGRLVFRKMPPSPEEIEENPRSRSAMLRSIEKL